jgi:hypothetical protein
MERRTTEQLFAQVKVEAGKLLAERDGWELRVKLRPSTGGWHNFVLVAPESETRKRKYYGGWNGERLAQSYDMDILLEHVPSIYRWLVKTCGTVSW